MKVEIISATRKSEAEFRGTTPLGISLQRLTHDPRLMARISAANTRGLPLIYNETIAEADDDSILVFMHDDVWIDDYFFSQRVVEGLQAFDVIGLAGNRRRVAGQPGWLFIDLKFTWDQPEHLTGAIAHSEMPFGDITRFGETPASCELLDGVLLAVRKSVLTDKRFGFDPRFDFHFYDLDFCRTARQAGLTLGTWPICVTHQSPGAYGTEQWRNAYRVYLEKWGS